MTEIITDLMKQKYGLSKVTKSLRITAKDDLYSAWKKTAKYIYQTGKDNGDWNKQTEVDALQQVAEGTVQAEPVDFDRLSLNEKIALEEQVMNPKKQPGTGEDSWKNHLYVAKGERGNKLLIVDPDNHFPASKHGRSYIWRGTKGKDKWITRHGWEIYNQNLLIGYDKLNRDISKQMEQDKKAGKIKDDSILKSTLENLSDSRLSKTSREYFFTEDVLAEVFKDGQLDEDGMYTNSDFPGTRLSKRAVETGVKRNKAIKYFEKYLKNTYNLTLQEEYDQSQERTSHAKFFQTKKNINEATQQKMTQLSNSWSNWFKSVEIDNDVDLKKLDQLKPQIEQTMKVMPKAPGAKPILRFRKLKNHKALGIFTPRNNTIAVDFRDAGMSSFTHEYGHFLDYNADPDVLLSFSQKFNKPLLASQHEVENMPAKELSEALSIRGEAKQRRYLETPTEVFAMAFEQYVSESGLHNSLTTNPDMLKNARYKIFQPEIKKDLKSYFRKQFPGIEPSIQQLARSKSQETNLERNLKAFDRFMMMVSHMDGQNVQATNRFVQGHDFGQRGDVGFLSPEQAKPLVDKAFNQVQASTSTEKSSPTTELTSMISRQLAENELTGARFRPDLSPEEMDQVSKLTPEEFLGDGQKTFGKVGRDAWKMYQKARAAEREIADREFPRTRKQVPVAASHGQPSKIKPARRLARQARIQQLSLDL